MSTPASTDEILRREENARIGAALAAIAQRAAPRVTPASARKKPSHKVSKPAAKPLSPWTRRKRPLYNF
jgi:hypothetical protein